MIVLRRLASTVRTLLGRGRADRDLDDELRSFVEMAAEQRMRDGASPDEAWRSASLELGGVEQVKERVRDVRDGKWIEDLVFDDVRYAVRRLVKRPAAALVSVVTLAIAIGAGVATWSLLSAVLIHPLPVANPDRLVVVGMTMPPRPVSMGHVYPLYSEIRTSGVFEGLAAGGGFSPLVTVNGSAEPHSVYFESFDFFYTLGIHLQLGRAFEETDDRRGAPPVAVLSDRFWRRMLAADPGVVGSTIEVAGHSTTIIGVAPRGFRGVTLANAPDLYMPMHVVGDVMPAGMNFFAEPAGNGMSSPTAWIRITGRLRPGMSISEAIARLGDPREWSGPGSQFRLTDVNTASLAEAARPGMTQFARLLAATVTLLLFIGCLTVGMLLLMRTEARRPEFTMCLALGATRARLARGVVIEGAILSLAGAVAALGVSNWLLAGARAFQLPGGIDIDLLDIHLDRTALAASVAAAVGATLTIAIVAATFGVSTSLAAALRAHPGATPRVHRRRTRAGLVVAQVAVALVLLTGAALFIQSLTAALSLNPGFDSTRIAQAGVALDAYGYSPERATTFFADLRDRLDRTPSIQSASLTLPSGGMSPAGQIVIDGQPRKFPSLVSYVWVDERYFSTIGLPVNQGRNFSDGDRVGTPRVAVVSASFGRMLANGGSPIGRRIRETSSRMGQPPDIIDVVGVVPDVISSVTTLEPLVMYMPLAQSAVVPAWRTVVLHASGDASAAARDAVSTLKSLDAAVVAPVFTTIDERLGRQMSPQRLGATVLGTLGVIAAILTLFGTYVLAESMSNVRRREMGIRAALGASQWQLGSFLFVETARLIGLGILGGFVLARIGADMIRAFLFRVEPLNPASVGGVSIAIFLLALLVTLRPALNAARVNLAQVLREE